MKKIVGILAAATMAASMFAVDVSATLNILGHVASKEKNVIGIDNTNFKDGKDLLSLAANTDKSGVSVGLGTNDGTESGHIEVRSASIWVKPVDQVKVVFGSLGDEKSFCEHICWWRTPLHSGSINGFPGVSVEVTAIDNLRIVANAKTGWGGYFYDGTNTQEYSLMAKYNYGQGDAAVVFDDKGDTKVIQVGGSYGNEWGGNFFGFVNVYAFADKDFAFKNVAVDNWFKFKVDALTASARVPVIIALDGKSLMMDWELKAEYPVSSFNVYGNVGSANAVWNQNPTGVQWGYTAGYELKDLNFDMGVRVGTTFNVGSAAFDTCVAIKYDAKAGVDWKVPFGVKVGF